MAKETFGDYSKNFITAVPADLESDQASYFRQTIPKFPEEAIYIYSFKENRMIFASGWQEVVGYQDDEINMLAIVNMSAPQYAPFSHDLNDKALKFIHNKTEDLEKYSFTIELKKIHKDGSLVPIIARVGIFKSDSGKIESIIGRFQINRSLSFGKVMRYAAFGPEKEKFEEELNKVLFSHLAISNKEKEALSLVAQGYSFKEVAHKLKVSHSAIEKRIIPLYKRFDVKSLTHLVSFAYDNLILPVLVFIQIHHLYVGALDANLI
ncbi:MAG: LuxR C-terminal-related transcriptional regulator [Bacteroidota bacterium]